MLNVLLNTFEHVAQQPQICENAANRIILALHYNALLEHLLDAAKQLECHVVRLQPSHRTEGAIAAGMLMHSLRTVYEMEPMAVHDAFIPMLEDIIPIVYEGTLNIFRTLHLCNPEPTPMLRERSYTF
ncbi:hypothetical protein PMAYCL1PPCAC_10428 [Pristionchus mayeri]|uniref:Uncharacterized protein n=1 Tax=Pristionchus mayeri TaxID=1317129 RepID=A0AAN5C7E0_9BILA|nr:hypothetical protein PMAYCL1PPCAC_10428 [Pristionchus mayeri]